jgi:TRAP-type C4-dicarboxylate transport system permease small subunit
VSRLPNTQVMPLIDRIQKLLEGMLVGLLAVMVVIVFANVVLRFVFHSGIAQTEELSRYAFVWLTFIGAVVVLREEGHLGVDSYVRRLSPYGRMACRIASDLSEVGTRPSPTWESTRKRRPFRWCCCSVLASWRACS